MCSRYGRWMEGKKRVVPREVCTKCSERGNHYREVMLNVQKSAEVIVAVFSVKDRINRSLKYDWERRNEQNGYRKRRKLLTKR